MFEQVEQLLAQLRAAWRFRWHAVITMWCIALLGWALVFLIPSRYQSNARVFVDTNSLLRPLLEGIAVTPTASSQVDLVRRALLGRPQLEAVIESTALKNRVHNAQDREQLVSDLMKQITITSDSSSPSAREPNVYSIAYMDADAQLAYTVVKSLVDEFVSQSVGANRSDADSAQKFLRQQIAEYEKRLTDSERRLADFKKANVGSMPDERGGYFERVQAETTALDQLTASLSVAMHKREELRAKLMGGSTGSSGGGTPADGAAPAVSSGATVETSVDSRIAEAQAKIEELLLKFTDQHPDVIALRATIARLQEQRQSELSALRQNQGVLGAPRAATSLVVQNLQIALNQTDVDIASLQSQIADRQRRVAALRGHINTMPEVEAELLRLNRDYTVTKTEYERLLQRLESAKLSDAADRVDEVRFKLIDPPVRALLPAKPKRTLLVMGVAVLALGAGLVLAWLLNQIRPVFTQPKQLARFGGVQLLGVVDNMIGQSAKSSAARGRWLLYGTAGSFLVVLGALIALHRPIEALSRSIRIQLGIT
jgi:polysaccharide chain length determinant protein (PEP-CTERM system associated)